ncbi:MAG: C25 family cysteine peptidase, partial [Bacteroidota bacterium]
HNGGRILPALNSDSRPVDLVETPSFVRGGGDGRFDAGDEVVFYATGPRDWIYDADRTIPWRSTVNPYSTQTHAFIRVDGTNAVRVEEPAFPNFTAPTVLTETIGRFAVEEERIMLLQDFSGSGLEWFGPSLDSVVPSRTVLDATPPGLANGTATIRSRVLASSNPRATFTYRAGSATATASPRTILIANQQGFIATEDNVEFTTDVQAGTPVRVDLQYSGPSIGKGWIDWVELFYPQRLQPENGYLRFTTPAGETAPLELQLSGFSETPQVWDVTESGAVRRLAVQTGGAGFRVQLDPGARPRELVAFVPAGTRSPEAATPVANQNLHSLSAAPDFVIVAPEVFLEPARELAEHRRRDGLTVEVAEVEQIYNEFSGGTPDMRAVRDYFRFLYTLDAGNLQYALLFGDGHYDFRGIEDSAEDPLGPNHVLPYETERTILQEASYTSDDYFGLLDDNEGVWAWPGINGIRPFQGVVEAMDIGIGRIPARTIEEARGVVAKIKHYESPETQGRWRTRYTFVADDEYPTTRGDGDLHTQNADVVAEDVSARFPEMKIDKVYAISYPAESTPNGQQQVPEATRAVVRLIDEQGSLLWNYSGHGGYAGLADEDLLTLEDIELLNNFDKLTTFVT